MCSEFENFSYYEKDEHDKMVRNAAADILNIFSSEKEKWETDSFDKLKEKQKRIANEEINRLLYENGKNFTSQVIDTIIESLETGRMLGADETSTTDQIKFLKEKLQEIDSLSGY